MPPIVLSICIDTVFIKKIAGKDIKMFLFKQIHKPRYNSVLTRPPDRSA